MKRPAHNKAKGVVAAHFYKNFVVYVGSDFGKYSRRLFSRHLSDLAPNLISPFLGLLLLRIGKMIVILPSQYSLNDCAALPILFLFDLGGGWAVAIHTSKK